MISTRGNVLDKAANYLMDIKPGASSEAQDLIDLSTEALDFVRVLKDTLVSTGRVTDDASVDDLAAAVEDVHNELAAAVLFLGASDQASAVTTAIAQLAASFKTSGGNKNLEEVDLVVRSLDRVGSMVRECGAAILGEQPSPSEGN